MTIIDLEKFEAFKKDIELKFELCSYLANSDSLDTDRIMVPKHMNDELLESIFGEISPDNIVLSQIVELTQMSQRLVIFDEKETDARKDGN